jgi:hypothetical protein
LERHRTLRKSCKIRTLTARFGRLQALDDDGKIKAPPSAGRMWLGCFEFLSSVRIALVIRFVEYIQHFNDPGAICIMGSKSDLLRKLAAFRA